MAKISELWEEVEQVFAEKTSTALKMAILEAHKILEAVLDSKKYPGKTVEKKLVWAGYSLKDKNGLREAIEKHDEILYKFDYLLTNLEAEDILKLYKKAITEISKKSEFSEIDRLKALGEIYFSPKNVIFWRNLGAVVGFFATIKLLSVTESGKMIVGWFVSLANLVISWQFLILILVIASAIFLLINYFANKSKIKIKE
jgi:hypothetical protein